MVSVSQKVVGNQICDTFGGPIKMTSANCVSMYFANNLSTWVQVGIEDGSLYFADALTDLGPS